MCDVVNLNYKKKLMGRIDKMQLIQSMKYQRNIKKSCAMVFVVELLRNGSIDFYEIILDNW